MKDRDNKASFSILRSLGNSALYSHRQDSNTAKSTLQPAFRPILLTICILLYFSPAILLSEVFAQEIVVNPSLGDEKNIKLNALRAIFSMRLRTWPDGTPVRVFVLDDDKDLHVKFAKKRLDIYPHQLRYSWDRLVYSGTGQAPTKVGSEKEMLEKVAATPGAIGYLPESLINDKVHVLNINTP